MGGINHEVGGFEVTVNYSTAMKIVDDIEELFAYGEDFRNGEKLAIVVEKFV